MVKITCYNACECMAFSYIVKKIWMLIDMKYGLSLSFFCIEKNFKYTKLRMKVNTSYNYRSELLQSMSHFSFTTFIQLGPKIKLWGRKGLENDRNKGLEKSRKGLENDRNKGLEKSKKKPYLFYDVCNKITMAVASTTYAKDTCMVDENEVENSMPQKDSPWHK